MITTESADQSASITMQNNEPVFDGQQIQSQVPEADLTSSLQKEDEIKVTSVSELANRPDLVQKAEHPEAKWFRAPGVPGEGEPPAFYDEKAQQRYPTLEDMAAAASGLRRQISEGIKATAPDDYEVSIPDEYKEKGYGIDKEDPLYKSFEAQAKEKGLTQDQFDSTIKVFLDSQVQTLEAQAQQESQETQAYIDEQMKALGPQAQDRISSLETFLDNSGMPDHAKSALMDRIDSAEVVEALEILRNSVNGSPVPGHVESAAPALNHAELQEMLSNPMFGRNAEYTQKVEKAYKEFAIRNGTRMI